MPKMAEEFLGYANEESAHADRLARRIVELGSEPDFSPDSLTERSYVAYDDSSGLEAMIRANQIAERVVIQSSLLTPHRILLRASAQPRPILHLASPPALTEESKSGEQSLLCKVRYRPHARMILARVRPANRSS